jgi:hypothetical protein
MKRGLTFVLARQFQIEVLVAIIAYCAYSQTSLAKFELGGACVGAGLTSAAKPPLSFAAEGEARKYKKWDSLIENDKFKVRANCVVPYLWEMLLRDLASSGRYAEAASMLDQLNGYKIILPQAVVSGVDHAFLASKEFRDSGYGKQFAVKDEATQHAYEIAKKKLASMPAKEKPPSPFHRSGACPFECCRFGQWKARGPVKLYADKESKKAIADVAEGEQVTALTGEVILDPVASQLPRHMGA